MRKSIALAFAACLPALAAAQMYKWVDEKGVTHYSETPPLSGKSQSVPIKPRAAPAREPARAIAPVKAGAPPVPSVPAKAPAEDPGDADLRRLAGEWRNAEGSPVRFTMSVQLFGDSVKLGFVRVDGGKTQINSRQTYEFSGADGQGRLSAAFTPTSEWDVRMTPARIDYRLRGDVLEATVTSSVFAGSYTLRQ